MWQVVLLEMVRVLTDDMADPPRNSDDDLLRIVCVSAMQVLQDADFSQVFTVSIPTQSISPDPTLTSTKDDSFVNLICLKAACILDRGAAAKAARLGISVRDGGSAFDNRDVTKARLALLDKGWCKVYEEQKDQYLLDTSTVAGAVVMTPFRLYGFGHFDGRGRQVLS